MQLKAVRYSERHHRTFAFVDIPPGVLPIDFFTHPWREDNIRYRTVSPTLLVGHDPDWIFGESLSLRHAVLSPPGSTLGRAISARWENGVSVYIAPRHDSVYPHMSTDVVVYNKRIAKLRQLEKKKIFFLMPTWIASTTWLAHGAVTSREEFSRHSLEMNCFVTDHFVKLLMQDSPYFLRYSFSSGFMVIGTKKMHALNPILRSNYRVMRPRLLPPDTGATA